MKKRILVVDDNAENRYLLHTLLQGNGYEVVTAANGVDALDKASQAPPDLIIADILMPVMDGFALCREWKKDEQLKGIPFVFYTATYTDDRDRDFALGLGADKFIVKPMEPEPFMQIIRETIEQVVSCTARQAATDADQPPVWPLENVEDESTYLKQYNAVLIRKLEAKMEQLERTNHELEKDIADRKRAQEALRELNANLEQHVADRTRELRDALEQLVRQEKLAVLGQLAGGVGHELRNPLGVIKNASYYLNLMLKDAEPRITETLQILEKEVVNSENIISSLLDYAYPKSPLRVKVDLGDLLEQALREIPLPPDIEVNVQLDKALPNIPADPNQLSQVFRNIIINAVQAMPEGGKLTLATQTASPGQIDVSITDTGAGIPKENTERIFEPLFTTKAKGIGLGLAIARLLVEAHNGSLLLQSGPGQGSVFTIRLPLNPGEVK